MTNFFDFLNNNQQNQNLSTQQPVNLSQGLNLNNSSINNNQHQQQNISLNNNQQNKIPISQNENLQQKNQNQSQFVLNNQQLNQNKRQESILSQLNTANLDLMTHLTSRSNKVMMLAQSKAKELKSDYVDSEHLLYGLTTDSEIYNLLIELKVSPQLIQEELNKLYKKGTTDKPPQISPRIKKIINDSLVIARKLGFEFIAPEHLLVALYSEGEGVGARILVKLGLQKEELNKKITGKKKV